MSRRRKQLHLKKREPRTPQPDKRRQSKVRTRGGDQHIVNGARCSWWDSIDKVSSLPGSGLPACPFCLGVLFECPSETEWWRSAREFEESNVRNLNYVRFLEWIRGKCFGPMVNALEAYRNSDQWEAHPFEGWDAMGGGN